MKSLERYVKKNNKSMPYGKTKAKGSWEGGKGIKQKDQYAKKKGREIVEDESETDTSTSGIGAYESVRGYGGKKKKPRTYLD